MRLDENSENIIFVEDEHPDDADFDQYETISQWWYDFEYPNVDGCWEKGWWLCANWEFTRSDAESLDGRIYRAFPTRYRLDEFRLTKSLRRVMNRNQDLNFIVRRFRNGKRKNELFERHYLARYGSKAYQSLIEIYNYHPFWIKTMEVIVLKNRRYLAGSIFQMSPKGVQSCMAYWDVSEPKRSLGILTALIEMQYAVSKRKKYYYLGTYFKQNPNFEYKTRFPALEFYDWDNNCWVDRRHADALLDQQLKRKEVLPPIKLKDFDWLMPCPTQTLFPEIVGIALFGSHAKGTERPDSDFDFLFVTTDIEVHFRDNHYVSCIGTFRYARREKWFSGETLRSFLREENGQIELNFVKPEWATLPPNDEAKRIFRDGVRILHDPQGILKRLQETISNEQFSE